MARNIAFPNRSVSNGLGFLKLVLVFALALIASLSAASPTPTTPESFKARDILEARSKWKFNCYSEGQACRGDGDTTGGGKGTADCAPISGAGCTRYSYDGGGDWKLCVYNERNCAGEVVAEVNGGSVSCLDITNPGGYLITNVGTAC